MAKPYAGFKKVSEDQHKVVMRHSDGHEVHVAKAALSPKMRGQLAEIPLHTEDTNPAGSRAVGDNKGQMKMADGGKVSQAAQRKDIETTFAGGGDKSASTPQPYPDKPTRLSPTVMQGETAAPKADPEAQNAKEDAQSIPVDFHKMADGGEVSLGAGALSGDAPPQVPAELQQPINPAEQSLATQQEAFRTSPDQAVFGTSSPMVEAPSASIPPTPTPMSAAPAAAPTLVPAMPGGSAPTQAGPGDDPYGINTTYGATVKGLNEEKAGIGAEAKALGAQGQAEAKVAQQAAANQQTLLDDYKNHAASLDADRAKILDEFASAKIDPHHYMGSMDTVKRVTTAIGLILGGLASGYNHTENPALKMLQANIDRDIEAQKANLGTKKSLLDFNQQQYGNLRQATEMTRVQMNDMASLKLKEAAATAQDPLAKARALQAAGKIDQQSATVLGQQAMRMTVLKGVGTGQVGPDQAVQFLIPPDQRPAATKELQEAQEAVKARNNALGAFDQVSNLATVGGGMMHPFDNPRQIEALTAPITAQLSKATAGKFTEQDAGMLQSLWPRKGDSAETQAIKRAQMTKLINEKMNYPVLKAWNLDPGHWGQAQGGGNGGGGIQESAPVQRKR